MSSVYLHSGLELLQLFVVLLSKTEVHGRDNCGGKAGLIHETLSFFKDTCVSTLDEWSGDAGNRENNLGAL